MLKVSFVLLLSYFILTAADIKIEEGIENLSLLENASISLGERHEGFPSKESFKPLEKNHINLGFNSEKSIWIAFSLENTEAKSLIKRLVLDNPLLESITLYETDKQTPLKRIGLLHFPEDQVTLNPSFRLEIPANTDKNYLLLVENESTALQFSLCLKNEIYFFKEAQKKLLTVAVFLGVLIALFIINFFLSLFLKDNSYTIYALYLLALMYQQITYLGVTPLLFSPEFVAFDNDIVVFKINSMIVFASLFAITFLKTSRYKIIHKIYLSIIVLSIIEMPLVGGLFLYMPEVAIVTGLFFIIFNLSSASYIYFKGYKQARFFVFAWSVLVIGFLLMIFDALGLISVMYYLPNFIMIATALEAILLSLAFTDRYNILRTEKEHLDVMMLEEAKQREKIISDEIEIKTEVIGRALEEKKVLLKELHHRTKNNLQLILSIVRMQADGSEHPIIKERFDQLESRIRAIAKTHEILYLSDDFEYIDMAQYLYQLSEEIEDGYEADDFEIDIDVDNVRIALREAVYIGLIVNELVTNSIKYAQCDGEKKIRIRLSKSEDEYLLFVGDNGQGYDFELLSGNSLGLTLVKTLAEVQLEGSMKVINSDEMHVEIRFKL